MQLLRVVEIEPDSSNFKEAFSFPAAAKLFGTRAVFDVEVNFSTDQGRGHLG